MFAKLFVGPFLGAVYASGWWAWSIFHTEDTFGLIVPLIILGIAYIIWLANVACDDLT